MASCFVGVWEYTHPPDPSTLNGARNILVLLDNMQFWIVLIGIAMAGMLRLMGTKEWRDVIAVLVVSLAVIFFASDMRATPYAGYATRMYTAITFFFLSSSIAWYQLYGARTLITGQNNKNYDLLRHCMIPVFALLLSVSLIDISNSIGFRRFTDGISYIVNSQAGLLRFEDSIAQLPGQGLYGWAWTYPTMGLLLRNDSSGALIMVPEFERGHWAPFNPLVSVPDLDRYYK